MNDSKSWNESKTIIKSIAALVTAASGVGLTYVGLLELTPVQAMLAAMGFTTLSEGSAIAIRFYTEKPIK